ncbi:MAG: endo alpha-1,4 polygalactosaminidase, partial [Solirubrobacterales bacterium]
MFSTLRNRRPVTCAVSLSVLSLLLLSTIVDTADGRSRSKVRKKAGPTIRLSTPSAVAGQRVIVAGRSFTRRTRYVVKFNGSRVASGVTGRTRRLKARSTRARTGRPYSRFKTGFTVPNVPPGIYKVTVKAARRTSSKSLRVTSIASATDPGATPGYWRPAINTKWQYQLTGTIDQNVNVSFLIVDLFDTDKSVVDSLRAAGKQVGCYFSAGSYENWRPDKGRFPADVRGKSNGWSGENWLDIRRLDVLGPIMEARIDACKAKGFAAID